MSKTYRRKNKEGKRIYKDKEKIREERRNNKKELKQFIGRIDEKI